MVLAIKAEELRVGYLDEQDNVLWAVKEISFEVSEGEIYCIVGESGSGKSTVALAVSGILPPHAVTAGELYVYGNLVIKGEERNYEKVRGRLVTYVPQSPGTSLNPYLTLEDQFYYVLKSLRGSTRKEAKAEAKKYLEMTGLDPTSTLDRYPHELSGGMQQRAAIALALSTGARVLVADEPTSSLDAHLRLQITNLLLRLRDEAKLTVVFITHDLLLASRVGDKVAVMYAGSLAEIGKVREVLLKPLHPYTSMLVDVIPTLGVKKQFKYYFGEPPKPGSVDKGCPFFERCPYRFSKCAAEKPELLVAEGDRYVACWLYNNRG